MRLAINVLLDYALPAESDVLLQIEAAAMADQRIVAERLTATSPERLRAVSGEESVGQRTWAAGVDRFTARYTATVDIDRIVLPIDNFGATLARDLPGLVLPYLLPSRYVESHLFETFVARQFGHLQGGAKVLAMRDWISRELAYVSGVSDGHTTASDTFVRREGVCRDFAHLMAAFARAASIPARLVSVYAPSVTPPDFHAVVEVWLEGAWHLVDATAMAQPHEMARIAVGRDATDIAFMTVFGTATLIEQRVAVTMEPEFVSMG
jgi:transglutaminase-like putative cysteine protease